MTAIGATASITAITAFPGSFKTTRTVWWIEQAIAQGEAVYVCNLNGIKIKGVIPWEDPTKWRELPPGSVLVVDEAQRFFRARRGGEPPSYITDMETIRHEGVRLIVVTQKITYLDSHLRGLIGLHEHMLREDGDDFATIVRCNGVMENTDELIKRKNLAHYDHEKWKPEKRLFELFDSAQVHTVKKVVKAKYKRGALLLAGCAAAAALAFGLIFWDGASTANAQDSAGPTAATPPPPGAVRATRDDNPDEEPLTVEEYAAQLVPRIPEAPYSAPIFDGASVEAKPAVYCMASEAGEGRPSSCTCLTEQGTRYQVEPLTCVQIARHGGIYNPFKRPTEPQPMRAPEPPAIAAPSGPAGVKTPPFAVGNPAQGNMQGNPASGGVGG